MNYKQTIDWLFSHLPMFQNNGKKALKNKLDNILFFTKYLGFPHKNFPTIHIAGTNGKGSSSHAIASVLQEAGYKVGLYTSPHLRDFRERIKINGQEIPEQNVIDFIKKHKSFIEENDFSFFELTVAMAFDYFSTEKVDIAVIEVGLGGLLDSTNIILPEVSLITNIGKDHTDILGNTLAEIALQKAGIIKENTPVVISEFHPETAPVFTKIAKEKNAEIYFAYQKNIPYQTDLKGIYQEKNLKGIVQTLEVLQQKGWNISSKNIENGLLNIVKNTGLKGRWQTLSEQPKIICDTGHNHHGISQVVLQISQQEYKNLHIVLGFVKEKDIDTILPLFPKNAVYYFCSPNIPRGLDASILKEKASTFGLLGNIYPSVNEALNDAKRKASLEDMIFVGGSTFVVAEVV
ncbi:MAG: folylpolyglutamate synthase/dihydrofolate synthase family protein [Capnocytophaga sp.]|nr:folylpolyglutamate synthase/dihydrofolate synthase family protein [Capnocytophaga sp.]